jgi:PAS domain S-box-containing protein
MKTALLLACEIDYKLIYEENPMILFITDREGVVISINKVGAAHLGYSPDELKGTSIFSIFHPDDRESVTRQFKESVEKPEKISFWEFRKIRKDGSVIWVREFSRPVTEENRFLCNMVACEDITEQKQIEQDLLNSRKDLARAQTVANTGSWRLDVRKNELWWSDETYRIFGLSKDTRLDYETFLAVVHPDDRDHVDVTWRSALQGEPYDIEHRIVVGDDIKWVRELADLDCDEKGSVMGAFGTVQDITRQKQSEEKLRRLTEELKRSNADLQQFAFIASHDLQSPLRNVEGFAALLARKYKGRLDPKADEYIDYILSGVKNMQNLISDVLEYSRLGKGTQAFSRVETKESLDRALLNLKKVIDEKGARIFAEGDFPAVFGDPTQLTSLFQNLIGNAVKFSGDVPEVRISVRRENDEYLFSVQDNGIGMEKRDMERIFLIFQRLGSKGHYEGTGIGLSICKKIVERHGGRIWAESERGRGSTFHFTLPVLESSLLHFS